MILALGGVPPLARSLALSATVMLATRVMAQDAAPTVEGPASQPAQAVKPPAFMRVSEVKDKSVELQVAARDYVRADGSGPRVGLVGVAHIGEKSFYRQLQKLLAGYDVVLYESVKPSGASKPGGETAEQRIESTKASMRLVRGMIETYRHQKEGNPPNLESLRAFVAEQDPRLGEFISIASVDAWGNAMQYGLVAGAADPDQTYVLASNGADGRGGGEGENADITLGDEPAPDPMALSKDDGLQSQLAEALGMEFQLDAMDYGLPNWRCSDMDMDELNRRLADRGLDFGVMGGTLAGSSLPAKAIKLLLGVMKMADSFMDGAITDTFKVVMIEMLGDPALTDMSLQQLGAGFGEVIINERNQVPLNDLKALIEQDPPVKSVAIFYGAGHMSDLDRRLRELGYLPDAGPQGERWLTGMRVDFTQSAVSSRELNQVRAMMKRMIRQQMGAK